MGIDDRLRDAARAVDDMWSDPEGIAARYGQLGERLGDSPDSSGDSADSARSASDATSLIDICRRSLAQNPSAAGVLTEAWQAQALARAIGGMLAVTGPAHLRAEARGLSEAGGRGRGVGDRDAAAGAGAGAERARVPRAGRLTGVPDPERALHALAALLGEVVVALVAVACATGDESVYWQCIDAIDAAEETSDRARGLLRRIVVPDRGPLTRGPAGNGTP
ncbi:DUF6099 family protein [Streptomyces sp. IBSNAI002]|uniref:DUF6099 family protein n=1 Tax=Streptomyces sp. IBSNAI002 TaxID=3457500 RepID=UPI003FD35B20